MNVFLEHYWPHILAVISFVLGATAAIHATMTKDEVRAAIGWVGVIMLSPILGAAIYAIAGINRMRRQSVRDKRQSVPDAVAHEEQARGVAVGQRQEEEQHAAPSTARRGRATSCSARRSPSCRSTRPRASSVQAVVSSRKAMSSPLMAQRAKFSPAPSTWSSRTCPATSAS